MSSNKYASPLRLEILPSRILLGVVTVTHLGAMALLFFSSLSIAMQFVLTIVTLGSLMLFLSAEGWIRYLKLLNRSFPRIVRLVWGDDDQWLLVGEDGEEQRAELLSSSYVHPKLSVVNLKVIGRPWYCRKRSFIFLPDNIDAETFRRLRIRLRWYSMPDQDSSVVLK